VILSAHCDDLDAWYASLDVFVLPSRNDPFGLVVAEAMVRGIPVIVSDGCGIADFLHDHDHALLFSADSSSSLRKAILEMQDCVLRKRVAENGQKTAQKHFSLQEMVKRYELLLQSAQSQ
jgi:glycosyltransferase involved in cell wall biosynthesis